MLQANIDAYGSGGNSAMSLEEKKSTEKYQVSLRKSRRTSKFTKKQKSSEDIGSQKLVIKDDPIAINKSYQNIENNAQSPSKK